MVQKSLLKLPTYTVLTLCIIVLILRFLVVQIPNEDYALFLQHSPFVYFAFLPVFDSIILLGFQFSILVVTCDYFKIYLYNFKNYLIALSALICANMLIIPAINLISHELLAAFFTIDLDSPTFTSFLIETILITIDSLAYIVSIYLIIFRLQRHLSPFAEKMIASNRYWLNLNIVILFFMAFIFYLNFFSLLTTPLDLLPAIPLANTSLDHYKFITKIKHLIFITSFLILILPLIILTSDRKIVLHKVHIRKLLLSSSIITIVFSCIFIIAIYIPYLNYFSPLISSALTAIIGFSIVRKILRSS